MIQVQGIITLEEEEEIIIDGGHIKVMPDWKWMLKDKFVPK